MEIAELSGKQIDIEMATLMDDFVPKLSQLWQERGQPLIELEVSISGLSFKQEEGKCILTLSEFVSMSHPLIVNVKKYLDGFNAELLVELIFHEVLHILLTDNWQVWLTTLIKNTLEKMKSLPLTCT